MNQKSIKSQENKSKNYPLARARKINRKKRKTTRMDKSCGPPSKLPSIQTRRLNSQLSMGSMINHMLTSQTTQTTKTIRKKRLHRTRDKASLTRG